jgi:hypothetical protein
MKYIYINIGDTLSKDVNCVACGDGVRQEFTVTKDNLFTSLLDYIEHIPLDPTCVWLNIDRVKNAIADIIIRECPLSNAEICLSDREKLTQLALEFLKMSITDF